MNWIAIVLIIGGSVAVFLVLREFWCWYFKINEIHDLLKDILVVLKAKTLADDDSWTCPDCKHSNYGDTFKCERCGYRLK